MKETEVHEYDNGIFYTAVCYANGVPRITLHGVPLQRGIEWCEEYWDEYDYDNVVLYKNILGRPIIWANGDFTGRH